MQLPLLPSSPGLWPLGQPPPPSIDPPDVPGYDLQFNSLSEAMSQIQPLINRPQ